MSRPGIARGDAPQLTCAYLDGQALEGPRRSLIASLTKPITATAVMQLVEAGEVDLDAPISDYVPEFRLQPPAGLTSAPPITLRHVLSHTSGLVDLSDEELGRIAPTRSATLTAISASRLAFVPASAFRYASEPWYLLSTTIERASGVCYPAFLRGRIFGPLGMAATTFDPREPGPPHLPAQGHFAGPERSPEEMLEVLIGLEMPGGGLWSTPEDLLRFGSVWLHGGEVNGTRILDPRTAAQMRHAAPLRDHQTGEPVGYGLGWGLAPGSGASPSAIAHSGATGSILVVDPAQDLVIVYLRTWWGASMDATTQAVEAVYAAVS